MIEPWEYLLGFKADAGDGADKRFLERFFCDCEGSWAAFLCSGEDGFDFFFAGELEGEVSALSGFGSLSDNKLGLLISLMMSLRLEMVS